MRGARVAKWLSAGSIACGLALAAASPAASEGLSAIVESISPREDVRSFDILAEGTVIELKPGETLVLGYMDSCAHEEISGAVVAIFGALVPLPNHAASAMRAALAVQERLRNETGKIGAFRIRIGLNTGSCVVGNVDSINRINYTAIGDSMNAAAHLEAANKELGTTILASDSTARGGRRVPVPAPRADPCQRPRGTGHRA